MNSILQTLAEVGGITTATKMLVDVLKAYAPGDLQPWILPMVALAIGLMLSFLYLAAQPETVWTLAAAASAVLRGVFGGIGAVVVTEGHKMARGQQ